MDLEPYPGNQIIAATHGKGAFVSSLYSNAPVQSVTSLAGVKNSNTVSLEWNTSIETNIADYELQRSTDGNSFSIIASFASKNLNDSRYTYDDNIFSHLDLPIVFYRQKINHNNQSVLYSNTISINAGPEQVFTVTGNPFIGSRIIMNFTTASSQRAEARLLDVSGKILSRQYYNIQAGINNITLDNLGTLPNGIYLLEFITPQKQFTQKVLKN